ncbi:MAG: response regulator [Burkholderiales bacterium]
MPREAPESPTEPTTTTVVCIEDHPVSMALVEALLSAYPRVRLLKAFNGRDGVRLVQSERPDLVLLDMMLPDISGLEVVRELSELIAQRSLRVVLLTGDSFSIDVVKAMSLGAHEYWPKPLTRARVTAGLRRVLGDGLDAPELP